jgi:hypothetical protein
MVKLSFTLGIGTCNLGKECRLAASFARARTRCGTPPESGFRYCDLSCISPMGRCSLSLRCESALLKSVVRETARYIPWEPGAGDRPWPAGGAPCEPPWTSTGTTLETADTAKETYSSASAGTPLLGEPSMQDL